jgi:CRP/FNR family cyclic AMP-dependent transcriptional regulator
VRIKLTLTHKEIAQMIGSSRETVKRPLADFRRRQLLQVIGLTLVIRNKSALEGLVTG